MLRTRAPQLKKMHDIAESKTGMATEDDARLTKIGAETLRVDVFEMLEAGGFHQISMRKRLVWDIDLWNVE